MYVSPPITPTSKIAVVGSLHTLTGLQPATTYSVTMTTRNDHGESMASEAAMVTTMDGE